MCTHHWFPYIAVFVVAATVASCKKNGIGGEAEIGIHVKHHSALIPGARVYIKYGAKEFPGKDVSLYDDNKESGIVGESKAHTHFTNLLRGNYYLYSTGYDSSISKTVAGGVPVEIKDSHEHLEVTVPVTE